ncbi:major capsid protein [Planctomyces sp. SH-PL14]|uniref:major capsid protein n=1 Tax=Planctomyces sp. SH-PL14 TaxID=1632864 RepID=UPI00078C2FB7|nr:hypothetical protein [Planctomyces sp. SH-PL14]AMV16593.1 hypothetical protein VT03_01805 [Planctomyces sp. SH-PL14]
MAQLGLTDLVKINDRNLADINVTDLLEDAPVLKRMAAVLASNGTEHKYLKQTQTGGAGFRDMNDGITQTVSADTLVTVTLKILDASFQLDKAYCDGYRFGPEAAIDREGMRKLRAAFALAEKQMFYGTASPGNSAGFAGLGNNAAFNNKDDSMVVDATGTTASTGSSVWLFRSTEEDLAIVAGNDGQIVMDESYPIQATGTNGPFPAYYTPITGWLGLQFGSVYSVVRICNLTEDSGKGLTDDLIAKALEKIPAGKRSNLFLAGSRRSQRQLQDSRTATNPTGDPAPLPESAFKIPFIVTDQIVNTETLLAAT